MAGLDDCEGLPAARMKILSTAGTGGCAVAVAMLAESLRQMETLSPAVSAEIWDCYAAVLNTQP